MLNVIIDESGAKGYANNIEKSPGEIGIVISYFLEDNMHETITKQAKKIYLKYSDSSDGKFHITSLQPELQKELRKDVYELLISNRINWSYQAIYTNGFYNENYKKEGYQYLKEYRYSMHVKLLFGISTQSLGYAEITNNKTVKILSDQLDDKIIKNLYKKYDEYFSMYSSTPTIIKNYNYETKKVESRSFEIKMSGCEEEKKFLKEFSCDLTCDDNELTLIADVLSNSILFHLKERVKDNVGIELNTPRHFIDHPLYNNLYMKDEKSFLDKVYPYKKI